MTDLQETKETLTALQKKNFDLLKELKAGEDDENGTKLNEFRKNEHKMGNLNELITTLSAKEEKDKKDKLEDDKKKVETKEKQEGTDTDGITTKGLGDLIVESNAFKQYVASNGMGNFSETLKERPAITDEERKNVFGTGFMATGPTGYAPENVRIPGLMIPMNFQEPTIADIVPVGRTRSPQVIYMTETTHTNEAQERIEGADYDESTYEFAPATEDVRPVGHYVPVTDEMLDDVPMVRSLLNSRLTAGLRRRISSQYLIGNGTNPNIRGILTTGRFTTYARTATATDNNLEAIFKAIMWIRTNAFSNPNNVVLHPNNWQAIRLLRYDTSATTKGEYIYGNPSTAGFTSLWGLPRVLTTEIAANSALVGDFTDCMQFIRRGIQIETGYIGDDFKKGQRSIRARMRTCIAVFRQNSFRQVTALTA